MGPNIFVALIVLSCVLEVASGTKFLLTAPKKLRYDLEFNMTITAFGVPPGKVEPVYLQFTGLKDTSQILNSTIMKFSEDGIQTWGVTFGWERMEKLDEVGLRLKMSSDYREESEDFLFDEQAGYIFIQTDKPLYTPGQTVKFRILAVDEYQRLAKYDLNVDIKNDKGIIVDRQSYTADDAFTGKKFELPKETPQGNWSITANFIDLDKTYSTVNFEVKEYVLPRFSATVETNLEVITKDINWVVVTVKARYIYGKPVFGRAEMQLGTWDQKNGIQLFPNHSSGELNEEGVYSKDVYIKDLFSRMDFPEDTRLYINVNVTENGTMENDTIEDTSTFIAHPYYVYDTSKSKQTFKPGFPYTLHTQVRAKSGTPASWVRVWIQSKYKDALGRAVPGGKHEMIELDRNGKLELIFDTPKDADKIIFKMTVMDWEKGSYEKNELQIPKHKSQNNEYLHISLEQPIKKRRDGKALLRYTTSASSSDESTKITVLVMSRGHVLYSTTTVKNSDGQSRVSLPYRLYGETSPSMWIVAYYCVMSNPVEYVIDSLFVDTADVCLEEISVRKSRLGGSVATPKPKDKFVLMVSGKPNMRVGYVAVDKAVFLLNNRQTLTRESMFSKLGSHDLGDGAGDGESLPEILKNSGLAHIELIPDEAKAVEGYATRFQPIYSLAELSPEKQAVGIQFAAFTRPQTIRSNFPESWMFEEETLNGTGRIPRKEVILPDSITTWSFMAVGLSANRGVCVSEPLEQEVLKLFFADVRLPYKVTRLEEVKVKIAVYNYDDTPVRVRVNITGDERLCFSENTVRGSQQHGTTFDLYVGAKRTNRKIVKVIPLKTGNLPLRVDLFNARERDTVERTLHVVAEGLRIKKSITFVLDPEAKHASFKSVKRNRLTLKKTATVSNVVDLAKKEQQTIVNLALPKEVVKGTEFCRISAFGDLMGDILNHAVIESQSLMDQPVLDAEEVLGDLGPTVHALLYANVSGLMDKNLREKGGQFVRHSVTRLLKYRKDDYFVLSSDVTKAKPATWLTTAVLKSLCHASSLYFVDREKLIDNGFNWLLSQVNENDTMDEQDWRLAQDSFEYKLMLSAEVLIAILECGRSEQESHLDLQASLAISLEDNINNIRQPMVVAKVAYALTLLDPLSEYTEAAVRLLGFLRRRNKLGQYYWSTETETDLSRSVPFWYHPGAKASSIEATAYALLVYLHHKGRVNVDGIADWLVAQRNANGAFIGAMDSTAAIQALSLYSLLKHGLEVDLHCNVSSDKLENMHSFKFTAENATKQESLYNVPVGQNLEVLTRGQGLGQMQINVEYNIPIDQNEHCSFLYRAEVKRTQVKWPTVSSDNPLCASCDFWCENENKTENETKEVDEFSLLSDLLPDSSGKLRVVTVQVGNAVQEKLPDRRRYRKRQRSSRRKRPRKTRRQKRFASAIHKKSICVKVCLKHKRNEPSGPTTIDIEMLSGYKPVTPDVIMMRQMPNVKYAEFLAEKEILRVQFSQIDYETETCVGIRAIDEEEVGRPMPASIVVREVGLPYASCAFEYNPLPGEESLQVFCADFAHLNKGECRCFSGICSRCGPNQVHKFDLYTINQESCKAPVAYKLQLAEVVDVDMWTEIDAKVLAVNKTGVHEVSEGDVIKMMSPNHCYCPVKEYKDTSEKFYMLSADVEKLVDRRGTVVHRYLLDEKSLFLRVTEPGVTADRSLAVPFPFLKTALSSNNKCDAYS